MSRATPALVAALVVAASLAPARAWAWGAGIAGYSGRNGATCSECHFGGAAPTVMLSGPAALLVGQSATYTLDVVTGASTAKVGFDVAAEAGTLSTVAGQPNESWIDNGELAHTKNWPSGKTVQVQFTFTAPAEPGPLTLYLAGLRSDGVDDRGGDGTASTTLAVNILGGDDLAGADLAGADLAGADLGDVLDFGAVDAVSSATTVQPTPRPDAGPPRNEARWACDCRLAGRGGSPNAGPLLLVVISLCLWIRSRSRA